METKLPKEESSNLVKHIYKTYFQQINKKKNIEIQSRKNKKIKKGKMKGIK